jgi:SsrA-binding protein
MAAAAAKGPGRTAKRAAPAEGAARYRQVARNRRARHEYDILETFECGIALQGSEVKSLRAGRVSLQDAYARVERGEAWLLGCHVAPYEHATGFGAHDPDRPRKLLLHRSEIDELLGRTQQQSLTMVPLSIYFKEGKAKVELALARGRRLYDKRRAIATRDAEREAAREAARASGKGVARGSRRELD